MPVSMRPSTIPVGAKIRNELCSGTSPNSTIVPRRAFREARKHPNTTKPRPTRFLCRTGCPPSFASSEANGPHPMCHQPSPDRQGRTGRPACHKHPPTAAGCASANPPARGHLTRSTSTRNDSSLGHVSSRASTAWASWRPCGLPSKMYVRSGRSPSSSTQTPPSRGATSPERADP
jgi:hypothetical protein